MTVSLKSPLRRCISAWDAKKAIIKKGQNRLNKELFGKTYMGRFSSNATFLPFLALVLCLPIDGVASNNFYFYYMERLGSLNFSVWLHFF